MKSVGIKVLKDKLSAYLKLVREGEIVLVTDRDQVIAEIRRPGRSIASANSPIEEFLRDAAARGEAQLAQTDSLFPATANDLNPPPQPINVKELLNETRKERF